MIIGLTGKNGAGKGEVAQFLIERGYHYYSLSDVIRDELKKKRKKVTRDNLIATGNALREQFGSSVLADKLIPLLRIDKNYVIDSIRNPAEAQALKKMPGFALCEVAATQKKRFERIKKRKRENDPRQLKQFIQLEKKESKSENVTSQQLDATAKLADFKIANNGTLPQLHQVIAKKIQTLLKKNKRPSWDQYFMDIARMVSMRSNCVKRKVAAVLVKDKRIIATGYNGTPRGVVNCNEGGCPRCNAFGVSGQGLGECLCSHAEENAITQSAYHGVNIKNATLYSTYSPCLICTKMIINSGVQEVVFDVAYSLDEVSFKLLTEAGVVIRKVEIT